MRFQDYMIEATKEAANEAFKYARAVPADKVTWSPEGARSALSICQELALCPKWAEDIINGTAPEWNEETMKAIEEEQAQFTSIEACEAECNKRLESLFKQYADLSHDRLMETMWLPFDGGRDFTVQELMDFPRWNFTYHLGQIAYIQTMLGDKDMH